MRAAGVSLWRITFPYLVVGVSVSALLYCLNDVWFTDAADRGMKIRRRYISGTNEVGWIQRLNFANEADQRYWNVSAFNPITGEMRVPSFREALPPDAFRVVKATSGRWVNGAWRLEGTQEFIHRHARDPSPGTKGQVYVPTPEFTATATEISAWPGTDTVITNVLWRTNVQHAAAGGQRWSIGAYCPTNGELQDITLHLPLGPGAQRQVSALGGVFHGHYTGHGQTPEGVVMVAPATGWTLQRHERALWAPFRRVNS